MSDLNKLWKKGTDFLGCEYAILCGAMSWVSESNLVAAISNAGAFGVIACGSMNPDLLRNEIKKTKEKTTKNFGVNLITMHPQLDQLIDVVIDEKISHCVLAGGLPKSVSIKKLKEAGVKVICFAPAIPLAKKLVKDGADALVIEGSEAGGHIGPVATSVLAQEILPFMREFAPEIPVFVAGGIGNGEAITGYLRMGASGCQLGSKFVCATESIAHPNFKRAFIKAQARDALPSVQIFEELPVIPVRAVVNKGTQEFERCQREVYAQLKNGELNKEEAQLKVEHFWAGALKRAVIDGDIESGSIMAGQSVGMVTKEQPAKEIIEELTAQAIHALNA
jgi:enoyl-[acyl-carrier protein] reductase II